MWGRKNGNPSSEIVCLDRYTLYCYGVNCVYFAQPSLGSGVGQVGQAGSEDAGANALTKRKLSAQW
eukprot:3294248-Rhodomonas_salina.1